MRHAARRQARHLLPHPRDAPHSCVLIRAGQIAPAWSRLVHLLQKTAPKGWLKAWTAINPQG